MQLPGNWRHCWIGWLNNKILKIVHIMIFEKFIRGYIEFIKEHFDIDEHRFFVVGKNYGKYNLDGLPHTRIVDNTAAVLSFNASLYGADKIILHGLWNPKIIRLLNLQPWLITKCYWMMWGGDFYNHAHESVDKKKLIKKIRHFITFVKGDFEFAQKHYGASGTLHPAMGYPGQLFENIYSDQEQVTSPKARILLGNSADTSNKHMDALQRLKAAAMAEDIEVIVCPLSYGGEAYAEDVIKVGKELFGDKFMPLKDFMSFDEYTKLLVGLNTALFNHDRQQGLGNIVAMLGNGKKVFFKKNNTLYDFFQSINVTIYDMEELDLSAIPAEVAQENIKSIKEYFSTAHFKKQLSNIFYS